MRNRTAIFQFSLFRNHINRKRRLLRNCFVFVLAAGQSMPIPSRKKGFTLLELLVVMVIIGLLVGYVAPNYFSVVGKSEVKATKAQIDALHKAVVAYRLDVGHYPPENIGLNALYTRPPTELNWHGPYMSKSIPLDAWGHPYVYKMPGQHEEYDIISYGSDGRPGGDGEDADLGNW